MIQVRILAAIFGRRVMPSKWKPNPINEEMRYSPWLSAEARSQNPHKMFAADPAKADYYKRARQRRQNNPDSLAKQIARRVFGAGAASGNMLSYARD
jgi:hypothetical protein